MKNIKNTKTTIIMIALVLVVGGTTLAPIQSYATRSGGSGGFPDTSSLKHGIRDGVNVNLEHRDQHMDQENLCYRTNTCRQSDVGQNTLGNDNSVTGFTDQSDNLKQSTTANKTTPIAATTPTNLTTGNSTTPVPTPGTCQECFTAILNSTQITTILDVFDISPAEGGLTALCGILSTISETNFRAALLDRIDVTTIDELIACLKAAGIVFAP